MEIKSVKDIPIQYREEFLIISFAFHEHKKYFLEGCGFGFSTQKNIVTDFYIYDFKYNISLNLNIKPTNFLKKLMWIRNRIQNNNDLNCFACKEYTSFYDYSCDVYNLLRKDFKLYFEIKQKFDNLYYAEVMKNVLS